MTHFISREIQLSHTARQHKNDAAFILSDDDSDNENQKQVRSKTSILAQNTFRHPPYYPITKSKKYPLKNSRTLLQFNATCLVGTIILETAIGSGK